MYARVPGLWYERQGAGDPVVLLHGLGDSLTLWRHQIGPLSADFDVVAVDLRGHGRSASAPHDFTLEQIADDVVQLVDELGLRRITLVGLSMGGGVAQSIAVRHPDLLRALVLVSTSCVLPEPTRHRMLKRARKAEREGMEAIINETVPRWFTSEFGARCPDEVNTTRSTVLETPVWAFAAASRANAVRDFTDSLDRITCPVLFIGGAEDPAEPLRSIETYRRGVARFESHLVRGASHLVPVEAPDKFNAILFRFLAKQVQEQRGEQR